MKRVLPFFLALLIMAALSPAQVAAQECGQCYLEAMAGLHKAPEQPTGSVDNAHSNWADGVCYGYHGHQDCNFHEEEQQLLVSLMMGSGVEVQSLLALLRRHEAKVSFPSDRIGFEVHACGDPTDVTFVPLPEQTFRAVVDAIQDQSP